MNNYIVPNLSKACGVLRLLAENPKGVTAKEFEQTLGISRTTTFRILKTLCSEGMAKKEGKHFFAGPALLQVGLSALSQMQMRQLSVPVLQELTHRTGLTSHLAIPSGYSSLILEVCDSPSPIRVASRSGTLADIHCSATGKVFLAYLYHDQLAEIWEATNPIRRTRHTITSFEQMGVQLSQVRTEGYAIDDMEYHEGVRCFAVPVRDMQSRVVAAIGVTGPVGELSNDQALTVVEAVKQSAAELSKAMGYAC